MCIFRARCAAFADHTVVTIPLSKRWFPADSLWHALPDWFPASRYGWSRFVQILPIRRLGWVFQTSKIISNVQEYIHLEKSRVLAGQLLYPVWIFPWKVYEAALRRIFRNETSRSK